MLAQDEWVRSDGNGVKGPPTPSRAVRRLTPEEVFHAYAGRVYNLARKMLGQDADAEDVTQEVLLQVVRKLHTFRGDAEVSTWLHRVTVNAVLAHRRKKAHRPEFQLTASLDSFARSGMGGRAPRPQSTNPDSRMLDLEAQELIERAVAALPTIYRDVLVLSDIEQFTNPEIADLLGISLPAVKSRLHRARLILRDALAVYYEEVAA
jgi:RNA polymerase sigma-70 factor (ECF subfamily)